MWHKQVFMYFLKTVLVQTVVEHLNGEPQTPLMLFSNTVLLWLKLVLTVGRNIAGFVICFLMKALVFRQLFPIHNLKACVYYFVSNFYFFTKWYLFKNSFHSQDIQIFVVFSLPFRLSRFNVIQSQLQKI